MKLRYTEYGSFFVFCKPSGTRTHRVSDDQFGFVEYLSEKLQTPLMVVHRLDKETSGIQIFAKTKESASALSELFETQQIQKTYLFITDRVVPEKSINIKSFIDKIDHNFVNLANGKINSETDFEFVESRDHKQVWKAFPKTGKPHQIRLHAQKAGIPILGDTLHGGSPFHRLALHAYNLKFTLNNELFNIQVPVPSFANLFEDSYFSRSQLFELSDVNESFRLLHRESSEFRADIFGEYLWLYDYSNDGLPESDLSSARMFANNNNRKLVVRHMLNRGSGVGGLEQQTLKGELTNDWTARENGVNYKLRSDSGFSPGLFLDQKRNREWVRENSKGKKVLNLFSYTLGFSVNAALGGAVEVTSVDVSKKFLEWGKENFQLNNLDFKNYEFFAQDSLLFLKGSIKRKRNWDLIICDPPSFGRSKDNVWKLDRNLPELAELLVQCLSAQGKILFTSNLENMSRKDLIQLFCKNLKGKNHQITRMPMIELDYEETDDIHNLMKGFIFQNS